MESPLPDLKRFTILVVDDDPSLRKSIAFDFKRKGFTVMEAEDGVQAFEIIKNSKVDLVLSDVRMAGGNGIELLKNAKKLNPEIPIVMLITGFADLNLEDAYDQGADAVFTKPFDRRCMMEAVMTALMPKEERWGLRKHERLKTDFAITLSFPELNPSISARVVNVGRGGLFVALTEGFPKADSKVKFTVHFEAGTVRNIEGSGFVRWIRLQNTTEYPSGCGIEFEHLTDETRNTVIELINQIKTTAFIPKS